MGSGQSNKWKLQTIYLKFVPTLFTKNCSTRAQSFTLFTDNSHPIKKLKQIQNTILDVDRLTSLKVHIIISYAMKNAAVLLTTLVTQST